MSKPNEKWRISPTSKKMDFESNWRNSEKNQAFFSRTVYDHVFLNHAIFIWEFQSDTHNTYQRNIEAPLNNYFYRGKEIILNILIVCLYSCLNYPAWNAHAPYHIICGLSDCIIFFFALSHKWQDFQKDILDKESVFGLSTKSAPFLTPHRIQRYISTKILTSSCKVPAIFLWF
jgi:hypothetical protein